MKYSTRIVKYSAWLTLALIAAATFTTANASGNKRAFVLGIGNYDNLQRAFQLENPVPDSKAIAKAFQSIGYEVAHKTNLSGSEFYTELYNFLENTKSGDTVVLFLSGHGIELDGQNYLLPRDVPQAEYGRETKLRRLSISVSEVLQDARKRKPENLVLILDACRTHPLIPAESQGNVKSFPGLQTAGIRTKEAARGEYLMYSAGSGQEALDKLHADDTQPYSLYVRHLLPLLSKPDLEIGRLNDQLQKRVAMDAITVNHSQIPTDSDQIVGDFCFAGCVSDSENIIEPTKILPKQPTPSSVDPYLFGSLQKNEEYLTVSLHTSETDTTYAHAYINVDQNHNTGYQSRLGADFLLEKQYLYEFDKSSCEPDNPDWCWNLETRQKVPWLVDRSLVDQRQVSHPHSEQWQLPLSYFGDCPGTLEASFDETFPKRRRIKNVNPVLLRYCE